MSTGCCDSGGIASPYVDIVPCGLLDDIRSVRMLFTVAEATSLLASPLPSPRSTDPAPDRPLLVIASADKFT